MERYFIHFYTGGSIEWRENFRHFCVHSKISEKSFKISFDANSFENSYKIY